MKKSVICFAVVICLCHLVPKHRGSAEYTDTTESKQRSAEGRGLSVDTSMEVELPLTQEALAKMFPFLTFVCFLPFVKVLSDITIFWNAKRLKIGKTF